MAKLNMDYYISSDDDVYSDGSIETVIYERVKERRLEIEKGDPWPVVYHLSKLRHNILNWYPFKTGSSILEIGAGCGALTGLLAEKAGKLVSVELTKTRASIAYERNKDRENVEIIVGDINRMVFDEKFDYIICNGVLEYAGLMIHGSNENPGLIFLALMKKWLKQDGIILLAIENRLGLKYFAGSKEDHLGKPYAGINGYGEKPAIRTYSRGELEALCEEAGLTNRKVFFPFPDYKFPMEIFTDQSVNQRLPMVDDIPLDTEQFHVFDERKVYVDLMEHQAMQIMSNSFLIEASVEKLPEGSQNIDYVELNYQYLEKYGCSRIWNMRGKVLTVKTGNEKTQNSFRHFSIPDGYSLFLELQNRRFQEKDFWALMDEIKDQLFSNGGGHDVASFEKIFGAVPKEEILHWISGEYRDLDAWNVYWDCNNWKLLTSQSPVSFPIPAELALWRMIQQLRKDYRLLKYLPDEKVVLWLDLHDVLVQKMIQWNEVYEKKVLGQSRLPDKTLKQIDVEDMQKREKAAKEKLNELNIIANSAHDDLYKLAGLKSYRIAYGLYKLNNSFLKGTWKQKIGFIKWVMNHFRHVMQDNHDKNPLLTIADKLNS